MGTEPSGCGTAELSKQGRGSERVLPNRDREGVGACAISLRLLIDALREAAVC
jgi:hypothetical protein